VIPELYVAPDPAGAAEPSSGQQARPSEMRLRRERGSLLTRLASAGMLGGVLWGVSNVGLAAYRVATDAFVSPLILSQNSDEVVQSKLSLSHLLAERDSISVRVRENEMAVQASEQAIQRLEQVRSRASQALDWSVAITAQQTDLGERDLSTLGAQQQVLQDMLAGQEELVGELREHLSKGMVHKADLSREELMLNQLRLAALSNERDRLGNEQQRRAAELAQRSLERPLAKGIPPTPDVIAHQDQLAKLELDVLKLRAEVEAKRMQSEADRAQLAKLDALAADMKQRPIFRAIDSSQNVAFVPYTQLDGVRPDALVIECKLWGLFRCQPAGHVAELVPGEVVSVDPWGVPARGQYAILELSEPRAAESKSLRVRLPATPGKPPNEI
jgi:hypothetical protein